jgi:hypothetical protein
MCVLDMMPHCTIMLRCWQVLFCCVLTIAIVVMQVSSNRFPAIATLAFKTAEKHLPDYLQ